MQKIIYSFFLFPFSGLYAQKVILPVRQHDFVVIAHRGDHTHTPENTLAAYQNAIDNGVDFVEIDLRTTKDSQLVIMHDGTVNRMTEANGKVNEWLFDSLRTLKVADAAHPEWGLHNIPSFKEVLQLCKGKINIYLDFKAASVADAYKEIVAAGMEKNMIVYINAPQQFTDWRRIAPQMPLMISLPQKASNRQEMNKVLEEYKIDILDGNYNEYSVETILAAKEKGIPVWADIQSPEEAKHWEAALKLGLQGLQTDHPKELIDFLIVNGKR